MGYHLLVEQKHSAKDSKTEENQKKKKWVSTFMQNEFLEKFNSLTNLFKQGADLDEYGRLITKLKGLPELTSVEQKAVLAYTILFDHDESMFEASNLDLTKLFDNLIRTCEDCLNLSELSSILMGMANFCACNIDWNDPAPVEIVEVKLPYDSFSYSTPIQYTTY